VIAVYNLLFVLNSNRSSICRRYGYINDVNISRSKPFRPFPMVIGPRWQGGEGVRWSFLLVFYSDPMPETHPHGRQTDGRIAALLKLQDMESAGKAEYSSIDVSCAYSKNISVCVRG